MLCFDPYSPSHIEFELMGEMQSDLGGRQPVLQPGEDEDTLYETPGFSHVRKLVSLNFCVVCNVRFFCIAARHKDCESGVSAFSSSIYSIKKYRNKQSN